MWLDGMSIPGWLRPWVGWVVGTDWPEADERKLFKLADDLVLAARQVVAGADGAGSRLTESVRGEWDGNALNSFVKRVNQQVGGRQALLVQKLIGLAIALNELGVQVQYTKRMIKLAVLLFIVQMLWLAWALLNPAGRLTATALMGVRAQTARWTVRQFRQRLLMNVAMFGVLMGGMDFYIQKSQDRRDGMDWKQLLSSVGMGALTGAGLTALAWAVPTKSMWMLMGHSGIASAGATLVSEVLSGGPIDWTLVAKGGTSGIVGGADAHWASWSPGSPHVPGATSLADAGPPRRVFEDGPAKTFNGDDFMLAHRDSTALPDADGDGPVITPRSEEFDPGKRTPLLPVHDRAELAQFRGDRATTIDPTQAVRASEWNDLRERTPPAGFGERWKNPDFERSSKVEIRRMVVTRDDGSHPVTEATVKVRYVAERGLSPEKVALIKSQVLDGVDLNFNHQHRLRDGSQLHVRVEFEEVPGAKPGADHVVTFRDRETRANMLTWYADSSTGVHAHELGHHLGLLDEYVDAARFGRRTPTDVQVRLDGSLYGSGYHSTWGRGGGPVFDHNGVEVGRSIGLRDRHLDLMERLMEDGRATEGQGGARRPAEHHVPPMYTEETLPVPPRVSELLKRFPPPDGTDFLTHALLLDKVTVLYRGVEITQAMVDRTQALVDIAGVVYQAEPTAVSRVDVMRLHRLTSAFDPHRLPDANWLADQVSQVVKRPELVRPEDVEALGRMVAGAHKAGNLRHPGESGVDYVHRITAEFLGKDLGSRTGRVATNIYVHALDLSEPLAAVDVRYSELVDALRHRYPDGMFDGEDVANVAKDMVASWERAKADDAPPQRAPRFEDEPTTFTGDEGRHAPPADATTPRADDGTPRVSPRSEEFDPAQRPPLLPVHDDAALAQLRGRHVTTVDPATAVRAAEWEGLRGRAEPEGFGQRWSNSDWERSSTVEVRRMIVQREDGSHPVTETTVKFRYVAETGMTPEQVALIKSQVLDGVDLYFNHQHRLSDGSQLHIRVEFEEVPGAKAGAGDVVTFKAGAARADMLTWYEGSTTRTHAHEVGHHLGLPDEYVEATHDGRRTIGGRGVENSANIYGNGARISWTWDGLVRDHNGFEVSPVTGLRDRHIGLIEDMMEQGGAVTEGRGAAPTPAQQHVRPDYNQHTLDLPPRVEAVLSRFPPPAGADFLTHVRLLDQTIALHGDKRIVQAMIDRTQALIDTAAAIYGTVPSSIRTGDLINLNHLTSAFDPVRLPDAAWFTKQMTEALGDRPELVTPRNTDALSRLVRAAHGAEPLRRPDESGVDFVRGVAARFLHEDMDPSSARRAAAIYASALELSEPLAAGRVAMGELNRRLGNLYPDGGFYAEDVARVAGQIAPPHASTGRAWGDAPEGLPFHPRSTELDPGQRTPLLPVHDRAALAELRGERATTIDPGRAVRASEWEDLRQRTPPEVHARWPKDIYRSAADLEVRRMSVLREDGWRAVTEATLTFRYVADGMAPERVVALKSQVLDGVDLYFNHQHRLSDGSQLHVRVEFEEVTGPRETRVVTFNEGFDRANTNAWYLGDSPHTHAHEVGHYLDLSDEYRDAEAHHRRTITSPGVVNDTGIYSTGTINEWSTGGRVVDHTGAEVKPVSGLRDRHLDDIERLLRTGERTEGLGALQGPAEPRPRVSNPADLRMPAHVETLMQRFPPPAGRDPVTHALILDRTQWLNGRREVTEAMVRRTEALFDTARELFGTTPAAVRFDDLRRLNSLSRLLDPHQLPDAAWLLQQVDTLIDGPVKASPRLVEGMGHLVDWFYDMKEQVLPGETGHAALTRAAAELLGTEPGPVTNRRVAINFAYAAERSEAIASGRVNWVRVTNALWDQFDGQGGFSGADMAAVADDVTRSGKSSDAGDAPQAQGADLPRQPRSLELNPDLRTPLVPVHDPSALAQLRGDLSTTLDPATALRASEWQDLRTRAGYRVLEDRWPDGSPDWEASSRVEVRRMRIGDQAVTEFTVRVRYVAEPRMSHEQVLLLKSEAMDGVDLYFNHQHRLPDGSQLHVRLEFQEWRGGVPGADNVVTFRRGDGAPNMLEWYASRDPQVHAHELGHHLGLPDEYHAPDTQGRRTITGSGIDVGPSLYSNADLLNWMSGQPVLDHTGHAVTAVQGLPDHLIDGLGRIVDRDLPVAVGEGAFRQPADERARPVHTPATLQMPEHVRTLLDRFPRPDGTDLVAHTRILDRTHALFGQEGVTGRTVALVAALHDLGHSLFGAVPETFLPRDLYRMNRLVELFDLGDRLPDAAWVREKAAEAMGGRQHVNTHTLDGLARVAHWFHANGGRIVDGETGIQAMHRAAGEFLGRPPGEESTRRAGTLLHTAADFSWALADHQVSLVELKAGMKHRWPDGESFTAMELARLADDLALAKLPQTAWRPEPPRLGETRLESAPVAAPEVRAALQQEHAYRLGPGEAVDPAS